MDPMRRESRLVGLSGFDSKVEQRSNQILGVLASPVMSTTLFLFH